MYTTVIWATDGSEGADLALQAALDLVTTSGGRIVAVHANQRLTGRAGAWPAAPDEGDRLVKIREQIDALTTQGVAIQLVVRRTHEDPSRIIAAVAEELDADVIVCGTHSRTALGGAVLGSVAHGLVHAATCPVLIVPERAKGETLPTETSQEEHVIV